MFFGEVLTWLPERMPARNEEERAGHSLRGTKRVDSEVLPGKESFCFVIRRADGMLGTKEAQPEPSSRPAKGFARLLFVAMAAISTGKGSSRPLYLETGHLSPTD